VLHALSIDVEDWYHDGGTGGVHPVEHRVEGNTLRLLDLLAAHGVRATFFLLGEVVERFPALARRIAGAGHEIGSHGYQHRPVMQMTRAELRADVGRSLRVIEDATGAAAGGYRAPYFSIKAGVRWPIEIVAEAGVRYDASVLAIDRPPGLEVVSPREPYRHPNGLWEIPVAVLGVGPFWHLPLASGTGLRLLPRRLLDRWIRRFEREVGAGVFYLHPWEIDPASPTGGGRGRWLMRPGRARLAERLDDLLRAYAFAPIAEVFAPRLGDRRGESGAAEDERVTIA
jgi:polysaccharide deacetylase family protein (PEP-CTERM system associated)